MIHHLALPIAAMAVAAVQPATAQSVPTRVNSQQLNAICAENSAVCMTYILGAVDNAVSTSMRAGAGLLICFPPGINNTQIMQAALQRLRARPRTENANAASLVVASLVLAYPCARQLGRK